MNDKTVVPTEAIAAESVPEVAQNRRSGGQKRVRTHQPVSHTVRTSSGGFIAFKTLTRGMAIKMLCTECLGWGDDPTDCTSPHCPVYPWRGRTRRTLSRK
jgi:hypothetical protein